MHVPGWRGKRCVEIRVSVDPDHPQIRFGLSVPVDRSDREAMVAPECDTDMPVLQTIGHGFGDLKIVAKFLFTKTFKIDQVFKTIYFCIILM